MSEVACSKYAAQAIKDVVSLGVSAPPTRKPGLSPTVANYQPLAIRRSTFEQGECACLQPLWTSATGVSHLHYGR